MAGHGLPFNDPSQQANLNAHLVNQQQQLLSMYSSGQFAQQPQQGYGTGWGQPPQTQYGYGYGQPPALQQHQQPYGYGQPQPQYSNTMPPPPLQPQQQPPQPSQPQYAPPSSQYGSYGPPPPQQPQFQQQQLPPQPNPFTSHGGSFHGHNASFSGPHQHSFHHNGSFHSNSSFHGPSPYSSNSSAPIVEPPPPYTPSQPQPQPTFQSQPQSLFESVPPQPSSLPSTSNQPREDPSAPFVPDSPQLEAPLPPPTLGASFSNLSVRDPTLSAPPSNSSNLVAPPTITPPSSRLSSQDPTPVSKDEKVRFKTFEDRIDQLLNDEYSDIREHVVDYGEVKDSLIKDFGAAYFNSHESIVKARVEQKNSRNERERNLLRPTWLWKASRFGTSDKYLAVFTGTAINLYYGIDPSTQKPTDMRDSISIFSATRISLGDVHRGSQELTIKNPDKSLCLSESAETIQLWAKELEAIIATMRGNLSHEFLEKGGEKEEDIELYPGEGVWLTHVKSGLGSFRQKRRYYKLVIGKTSKVVKFMYYDEFQYGTCSGFAGTYVLTPTTVVSFNFESKCIVVFGKETVNLRGDEGVDVSVWVDRLRSVFLHPAVKALLSS